MINSLLERFKCSFFSIKKAFWLREYTIASLILIMFILFGYYQNDLPLSVVVLISLNACLFPFSKYLMFKLKQGFYRFVYQVELDQVYFQTGCLVIVWKLIKNLVLYFVSFIIGWLGLILMCLKYPKENEVK